MFLSENEDKINVDNETDYKFDINKKDEKGRREGKLCELNLC